MNISGATVAKNLAKLGRLTEVNSNIITSAAAMTITPLVILNSPYVKDKKTKEYSAVNSIIGAILAMGMQLAVSVPVSKGIDNLIKLGKIPYLAGSAQANALKLVLPLIPVLCTSPLYAKLINKFLPNVMDKIYKKKQQPENADVFIKTNNIQNESFNNFLKKVQGE